MFRKKLLIFKFLLQKEIIQLLRNGFLPRLIVVFPVAVILILPWAADMEIKNVNLSVLDHDKSVASRNLISKIDASNYFILTQNAANIKDATLCIETNECDIILEIPAEFERELFKENGSQTAIYANAINSNKGIIGSGYLASIINDFSDFRKYEGNINRQKALPPINIIQKYYFNKRLDYKSYMIPALTVMVLSMLCGFLPALNIVSEKEKGNIEQINASPVSRFAFIAAKLIPYWATGFLVLTICFTLAYFVYDLSPRGSIIAIYTFTILYVFGISGVGLVISNHSNTMQQGMFVIFFFMLILMLMSGLFTPVSSMPDWAQAITVVNPLKYFMESLRMIYLKGSPPEVLWQQFMALGIFAIIFDTWAVISYRKRG